jgi:hypothetical protein
MSVSIAEADVLLANTGLSCDILTRYKQDIFREAETLGRSLAPGWAGGLKSLWIRMTNRSYKLVFLSKWRRFLDFSMTRYRKGVRLAP